VYWRYCVVDQFADDDIGCGVPVSECVTTVVGAGWVEWGRGSGWRGWSGFGTWRMEHLAASWAAQAPPPPPPPLLLLLTVMATAIGWCGCGAGRSHSRSLARWPPTSQVIDRLIELDDESRWRSSLIYRPADAAAPFFTGWHWRH